MDGFTMRQAAGPDEPLFLGDSDGGSPSSDGAAMNPSRVPWSKLYDIRPFLERPFFSISHKMRGSLEPYVSRDGKLHVDVKATVSGVGVATYEDAEILMYVITELFASLMNDPSCREVTFKRCDLLRRLHRKAGGNQYDALEKGLIRLTTTQVVTNMGPDGRPAEPVVFSFLEGWEWSPTRRLITVRASEWIARAVASKAVLSVPEHYFDLPRGYERVLWRIARKHVGSQRQARFDVLVETLRDKMGAGSGKASFANKIKEIVERDPLPDYQMTWVADPVRKRHKVRMALRVVPRCMTSGTDGFDLAQFHTSLDTD